MASIRERQYRRLERLELLSREKAAASALQPSDRDLHTVSALESLLTRVNANVLALALEAYTKIVRGFGYEMSAVESQVFLAVEKCVDQHLDHGAPLEFPDPVASVYLADLSAEPLSQCERCAYSYPFAYAPSSKEYFDRCLFCGGRVGWNAFSVAQHWELRQEQLRSGR